MKLSEETYIMYIQGNDGILHRVGGVSGPPCNFVKVLQLLDEPLVGE